MFEMLVLHLLEWRQRSSSQFLVQGGAHGFELGRGGHGLQGDGADVGNGVGKHASLARFAMTRY